MNDRDAYKPPRAKFLSALRRIKRDNPTGMSFIFDFDLNDAELAMLKRHVKRHHPSVNL